MKKKTIFIYLLGVITICTTTSCKDVIDVDLRTADPKLVIEGSIRMGEFAEVLITKSKEFSGSNEYIPITDAVVTITTDEQKSEVLQSNAQGRYVATTIVGTERTTYHLSVQYDDVEYTATSYMPPRVEIDDLTVWKMPVRDTADPQIHFKDPKGEENQYYRCVLYINDVKPTLRDRLGDQLISTEFVDGSDISQVIFLHYETDRDDDPIEQGDKVTVEMQCIDKGVYKFFETLYNTEDALANPTSNIKGGALGYFGAYSYTSASVVMEWKD